jgi:hypothetical protein
VLTSMPLLTLMMGRLGGTSSCGAAGGKRATHQAGSRDGRLAEIIANAMQSRAMPYGMHCCLTDAAPHQACTANCRPTLIPSRKTRVCCTGTAWMANCAPRIASRGDVVADTFGGSVKSCKERAATGHGRRIASALQ